MSKEKLYKKLLQHEEEYFTLVDKMRNLMDGSRWHRANDHKKIGNVKVEEQGRLL